MTQLRSPAPLRGRRANSEVGYGDMRRTTCRHGIYVGDEMVWSRDPLGLVHVTCPTRMATVTATATIVEP